MKKIILSVLILALGVGVAIVLFKTKPVAEKVAPTPVLPAVEILVAAAADELIAVVTQGLVQPRTTTTLASEVVGRVLSVSEKFRAGGRFEEGETLLQIDDSDYVAAFAQAEATLADARLTLELEGARAGQALRDWKKMGSDKEPGDLVLRKPQIESANARVKAASAAVDKARRDLDRTRVKAPYAARVRAHLVDLGAYLVPGAPVAEIYAAPPYEIRLPLSLEESLQADLAPGTSVVFGSSIAGERREWRGTLTRQEGQVDRASRSLHVVAEIEPDADGLSPDPGYFLEARIEGRVVPGAFRVPRRAFVDDRTLLLVAADDTLEFRQVTVARIDGRDALVTGGIDPGERICTTSLAMPVAGTRVRVVEAAKEEPAAGTDLEVAP